MTKNDVGEGFGAKPNHLGWFLSLSGFLSRINEKQ